MELLLFVIAKTDATAVGATSTQCWSSGEHRGDLISGYWNWLLATGYWLLVTIVRMLTTEDTDPVGKAPRVC